MFSAAVRAAALESLGAHAHGMAVMQLRLEPCARMHANLATAEPHGKLELPVSKLELPVLISQTELSRASRVLPRRPPQES